MELNKMIDSTELLKEEQWRVIIQDCNRVTKSGEMTKREWLNANHIREATFYKWQQRLRNEVATNLLIQSADMKGNNELIVTNPSKEVEFVEVKPSPVSTQISTSGAVLKFNHVSIEINEDISERLLSKLFKVISNVE